MIVTVMNIINMTTAMDTHQAAVLEGIIAGYPEVEENKTFVVQRTGATMPEASIAATILWTKNVIKARYHAGEFSWYINTNHSDDEAAVEIALCHIEQAQE